MSITINANLEYLCARLNIPQVRLELYKDKTVDEILRSEAAQGNEAAVKLAADMFTDVNQLIELFRLADPENKLVIMSAMNEKQLKELITKLEVNDLVEGLNFFTQDALLDLLKDIPKEELVKTVFELFSEEQLISYMPEEEINKFLTGIELDKGFLLNNLKSVPEIYLQQMLESVTGESAQGNAEELVLQMSQLGDLQYKQALRNLNTVQKQELTLRLTSADKKLYENFSADSYTQIIGREREKDEVVKAMQVIKPEYLQKMIAELPKDLMAVVITQIDTEKFADALINNYPELLAQFVAGS